MGTGHPEMELLLHSYWALQVTHLVTTARGHSLRLSSCWTERWEDKTELVS